MAILKKTTKGLSAKRMRDIEAYDYNLFALCNPSTKAVTVANIIGVESALGTLKELRNELDAVVIDISEIDCNSIFTRPAETELEMFIKGINDAQYLNYRNDFIKMNEMHQLEMTFPRAERKKMADNLEIEIKKQYNIITTIGKLNKTIRKSAEEKTAELSGQLRDILGTLEAPDTEYINSMLYMMATSKVTELKNRLDVKIKYLTSIMEEVA